MVATLKDIAKQTGLSVPSVSLILNGQGHKFRTESCKAVFAAARELKYRPDMVMRRMGRASPRRDAVGLVVRSSAGDAGGDESIQEYMCGINDYLLEQDQLMVVVNVSSLADQIERNPPRLLTERFVDGLIVVDNGLPEALQRMIEDYEIMAVWLRHCNNGPHDCVNPDDVHAGELATRHLIELGHRHIIYLPAPWTDIGQQHVTNQRQQGYEKAMQAAGLIPQVADMQAGTDQQFHDVIDTIVASHRGRAAITGIVTSRFDLAARTLGQLNLTSLRCPKDVSVVSAGDLVALRDAWPGITRVRCDRYSIGRHAAQLLVQKIEQKGAAQPSRVFCGELLQAETTARFA